jgi:hypothetical protein
MSEGCIELRNLPRGQKASKNNVRNWQVCCILSVFSGPTFDDERRKMKTIFSATVVVLCMFLIFGCFTGISYGEDIDGNYMLDALNKDEILNNTGKVYDNNTYLKIGITFGLIRGAYEMDELCNTFYVPKDSPVRRLCLPSGVSPSQIYKIVHKYLKDNPAELHYTPAMIVHNAIINAFPCK